MTKKKRKKIASRGSVNDIILKTLVGGDKYGYEIIKEVEAYSEGKIQLKQPSLYSSLSRFEEKGYVSSYWGDSDIGGRRHYYHLTEKGQTYFNDKNANKLSSSIRPAVSSNISSLNFKTIKSDINDEISEDDELDDDFSEDENTYNNNDVQLISEDDSNLDNNSDIELNQDNTDEDVKFEEVDENDIPEVFNFENTDNEEIEEEYIPDHNFYVETPIERKLEEITQKDKSNEIQKTPNTNEEKIVNTPSQFDFNKKSNSTDNNTIWKDLAYRVKINNHKLANTKYKCWHLKQPKKSQIVILDKDGIYKLRDADYKPTKTTNSNRIIDNVGKRIENKNPLFANYNSNTKVQNQSRELSDEERKIRNENFLAKFNSLTKSKMKPTIEKKIEEKPKMEVDYRKKLDAFISNDDETDEEATTLEQEIPQNNLFNYVDEDEEENIQTNSITNSVEEDEDDKFINFEPVEFETKSDDKKYIDEISNFNSSKDEIKISRYENKSNAILSDKSYVLINKVKCLFGIILFVLMAIEISLSLIIFKKYGVIFDNDKIVFILSYITAIVVPLLFILPIFFSPNEHKINNFKLKYSIIFGILTFLVSIILIYCINSLIGFELDNFKYFAVKIILPIVLTFNFVITPPIYSALIKNKRFYD